MQVETTGVGLTSEESSLSLVEEGDDMFLQELTRKVTRITKNIKQLIINLTTLLIFTCANIIILRQKALSTNQN